MEVDDNGRTAVTVLDGEVALSNAVASVDLRTGQHGVSRPPKADAPEHLNSPRRKARSS